MIKGTEYLTKITMPPIIDIERDIIGYEVHNSWGKLWKFSSSVAWNDENKDFPNWINFNNVHLFEVVIDHNRIKIDTPKSHVFTINLFDDINSF